MTKAAIVILNWNGLDYLQKFLESVVKHTTLPHSEIFVADNGSTDGSMQWVQENCPEVKVITFEKNLGFAGGYNEALKQIDAEYFILLNSDIEVTKGWVEPLTGYLDSNPEVAACQPKVRSWFNRKKFEYAGAAGGYIDRFGYPFCRGRIFHLTEEDHGQYDDITDVSWTSGACMAVRADAWNKCGGFDPGFFAHMEEIDLCWRLHNLGYRMAYIPGSVVYHVGGGSLPYSSPFKTYLNFRNSLFMLYKNLPDDILSSTILKRKLLDGIAAVFFLLKFQIRSSFSVFKAHVDFYRSLRTLKNNRKSAVKGANHKRGFMMNKSIVFEFYIMRKRTYSEIIQKR